MAIISPSPKLQFFDNNGIPLAGGKIYTTESGTTTPQTTWASQDQSAANSNPIILNSRGEASIWITSGKKYDYAIYDANDTPLYTQEGISDNVPSVGETGTSSTSLAVGTGSKSFFIERNKAFVVGMIVQIAYTTDAIAGYMNGVVTSYSPATGEMTVYSNTYTGSGTYTAWTISLSAPPPTVIISTVSGTSSSSVAVGTGAKTFTTQTGLGFAPGMTVQVADTSAASTNYMNGVVTGYNTDTGVLVTDMALAVGTGTIAAWTITLSAPAQTPYALPTASAGTKGGIKIGARGSMTGDVFDVDKPFAVGTKTVFYQAAAPTGWTQLTTISDKALRVVSGAGGGIGGTHGLSSPPSLAHTHTSAEHAHVLDHTHTTGSVTLTAAQSGLKSHNHYYDGWVAGGGGVSVGRVYTNAAAGTGAQYSSSTGGDSAAESHNHGVTSSPNNYATGAFAVSTDSASPTAFSPAYVDVIICALD